MICLNTYHVLSVQRRKLHSRDEELTTISVGACKAWARSGVSVKPIHTNNAYQTRHLKHTLTLVGHTQHAGTIMFQLKVFVAVCEIAIRK